jgi:hypothetical protein
MSNQSPEFKVVGVYRIVPTLESISQAARKVGDLEHVLDEDGVWKEEIPWDQFHDLGLIELEIRGPHTTKHIDSITQSDQARSADDQVPYDEFYLDGTGTKPIDEEKALAMSEPRRVCFFLHFMNVRKSLNILGARFALPPFTDLPDRLKPFTHYLPPD